MSMTLNMNNSNYKQRGFTLIELMVGLALGLLASLAIFTAVTSFETQRRVTAAGADMQQNGLLALYSLEQDLRMAGFGVVVPASPLTPGSLPCIQIVSAAGVVMDSAPVRIIDGGNGPDTIITHRLESETGGIITGGSSAHLASNLTALSSIAVDTTLAIHLNDNLLIPDAGNKCSLLKTSAVNPPNNIAVTGTQPAGTVAAGTSIINLGATTPAPPDLKYEISSLNLRHTDNNGVADVASNIVNMQVQYGVANVGSQSVACWTDAVNNNAGAAPCGGFNWSTSSPSNLSVTPSASQFRQIKAIRVAIVARSSQRAAANACVAAAMPNTWNAVAALNQSGIANWGWGACYRYKVYQTIIPIRNVIWGSL